MKKVIRSWASAVLSVSCAALGICCSNGGSSPAGPPDASPGPVLTDAGEDAGDAGGTVHTVIVGPNGAHVFQPSDLSIHVGDTVHWIWASSGHNVSSGRNGHADSQFCSPSDNSCDIDPSSLGGSNPLSDAGATYDHRFTAQGEYPYFCRPHYDMGMSGRITVHTEGDADTCKPAGTPCPANPSDCCTRSCGMTPGSDAGLTCQ